MATASWEPFDEHEDTRAEPAPWLGGAGSAEDPTVRMPPELANELIAPHRAGFGMDEATVVEGRGGGEERASRPYDLAVSTTSAYPAQRGPNTDSPAAPPEPWAPLSPARGSSRGSSGPDAFAPLLARSERRAPTLLSRLWFATKLLTGSIAVMGTSFMVSRVVHDPHFRAEARDAAAALWSRLPFITEPRRSGPDGSELSEEPRVEAASTAEAEPAAAARRPEPSTPVSERSTPPLSEGAPGAVPAIPTVRVEDLPLLPPGCDSEDCAAEAPSEPSTRKPRRAPLPRTRRAPRR